RWCDFFHRKAVPLWLTISTACASDSQRTITHTLSVQVARPQSTTQKRALASEASSRASLNARLRTPAERNRNGLSVAAAVFRKSSRASARVCTNTPEESEEPSTKAIVAGTPTFKTSTQ